MKEYSELKKLAHAATQGEWACSERHDGRFWHIGSGNQAIGATHAAGKKSTMAGTFEANAKFIAKANPKIVLALIAEVEGLRKGRTDWQAECLKRGFEYVRESDDHYVLADIPEMAELLGLLLGVEVRSKDNDSYGETVSMLQDIADANSDAFHRVYELEKENESLKKDAARYRWLRKKNWFDSDIAVVRSPNESVKLGYDCPSNERLDDYIDNEMKESKS